MKKQKDSNVKIARRKSDEILEVCPKCLLPVRKIPGMFSTTYVCDNPECGLSGSIAIEVIKEDYEDFLRNHKKS